jgi:hypothetical protein
MDDNNDDNVIKLADHMPVDTRYVEPSMRFLMSTDCVVMLDAKPSSVAPASAVTAT